MSNSGDGSLASRAVAAPSEVAQARARVDEAQRVGHGGLECVHLMTAAVEAHLAEAFRQALARQPLAGAAVLALGGFGRRELAPYSDVDLMLLVPKGAQPQAAALARELFTPLWDAGLEPGSALRTEEEALAAAGEDHTVSTALLDARVIAGDAAAADALLRRFRERLAGPWLESFLQAKVSEMASRRERFGGSIYLLEPNLKTGVGGLRDLAAAVWIAKARHGAEGLSGILRRRLLPRREIEALRAARELLLRLRTRLHLSAGRRDDRLTFAAQEELARFFGYRDTPEVLGVELLMRDYYLAARTVEHAADAIVDRCTKEAGLKGGGRAPAVPLSDALELLDGRVAFRGAAALPLDSSLLVDLFVAAERAGAPVHSQARDWVAQEVEQRGTALASDPAALQSFLDYLQSPGGTGQALRGLYETGVLGGIFPELARLRARVQHDVYHVYTVDTHTVFALQKLLRLRAGRLAGEPGFTRMAQDLARPLPLYLGLFFHDLGKGLGGEHSVRGEALVREWAARVGFDDLAAVEDAAFLVREHLKLSQVAFRRDLSDPALVADVARVMGTRERLDMLYLLTYADISSVGPETWSDWRARLLAELYEKCRRVLDDGHGSPAGGDRTEAALAGARAFRAVLRPDDAALEEFLAVLPERYLATVSPAQARHHYGLWREARGRPVAGALFIRADAADAGELVVVADDRAGLLSLVAGTLSAHSIDILSAEIYSLSDGRVLDSFLVREPGGVPPSAERIAAALVDLERVLDDRETIEVLLARRRGTARVFAPGPAVPTKLRFDLSAARDATVVDVFTHDRVGLLHDLAEAFHRAGASIVLARVATEGNRATDGFYLQDEKGRKFTDPARLAHIERALRAVLREGPGEAAG